MGRILIVEDERDLRESLQEYFEDQGFDVETAADGVEAMDALAGELPCLVILDLVMPVMSGNEVYDRMQQDARTASVPVIVSTSDPSRAPTGVLLMRKPIDLRRLLAVVRQHCAPPG